MFKLNTLQKTKDGQTVKPFTVQGDMVMCFDGKGHVVIKKLSDFDFTSVKEEKEKVVTVQPTLEGTDEFYEDTTETQQQIDDGLIIEEPVVIEPISDEDYI